MERLLLLCLTTLFTVTANAMKRLTIFLLLTCSAQVLLPSGLSAQDEVRNWRTDFDGLIGVTIGQAVPIGSFASSRDTIQGGFASPNQTWSAFVECRPADLPVGILLRYSFLRLPFDSEALFQSWAIAFPTVTFAPRSNPWEIHAPQASLIYRAELMDGRADVSFGAGIGLHRFTRPKLVIDYRVYETLNGNTYSTPWTWVQEPYTDAVVAYNAVVRFGYAITKRLSANLLLDYQHANVDMKIRSTFETIFLPDTYYYDYWDVKHTIQIIQGQIGLSYRF
jgi:hypothetical protein